MRRSGEITREVFDERCRPRFGAAKPERVWLALWEWMIRGSPDPAPGEGVLDNWA
jgi:hypothetical protein